MAGKPKRTRMPRRQNKGDNLLTGPASRQEIECDFACVPLQHDEEVMNKRWGIGRLEGLVPDELAKRYGTAISMLREAIDAAMPADVLAAADVCRRGLNAMDQAAKEAGHVPGAVDIWEYDLEGFHVGIVQDAGEWKKAQRERPGLPVYSVREVVIALKFYNSNGLLAAVKESFPGASISNITPRIDRSDDVLEDDIPPL